MDTLYAYSMLVLSADRRIKESISVVVVGVVVVVVVVIVVVVVVALLVVTDHILFTFI